MYIICFLPESLTFIKKPHTHCTYRKSVMITNMKLSALSSTPRPQQPLLEFSGCARDTQRNSSLLSWQARSTSSSVNIPTLGLHLDHTAHVGKLSHNWTIKLCK